MELFLLSLGERLRPLDHRFGSNFGICRIMKKAVVLDSYNAKKSSFGHFCFILK